MNIETKPGSKVLYSDPAKTELRRCYSGGDSPEGILEPNETYTVKRVVMGPFSSVVTLKEFPDKRFNTVHFSNL